MNLAESCACGAVLNFEGIAPGKFEHAAELLAAWRETHKHRLPRPERKGLGFISAVSRDTGPYSEEEDFDAEEESDD